MFFSFKFHHIFKSVASTSAMLNIAANESFLKERNCQVFSNNWLGKQQRKLWDTFDKPASSNAAKVGSPFCLLAPKELYT